MWVVWTPTKAKPSKPRKISEEHLLQEARKDVEARNSAEERFKKEIAELRSKVKAMDNKLACGRCGRHHSIRFAEEDLSDKPCGLSGHQQRRN